MKNIFKLTEGDLTKIVKRVIKESIDTEKFLSKVSSVISFPYIDTLESFGIPNEDWEKVFSMKYGEDIKIEYGKGNMVYVRSKNSDLLLYVEGDSPYYGDGFWVDRKYNENGQMTYIENSNGDWSKNEYDEYGSEIYYENSDGEWWKHEYDEDGNEIYYEDSDGVIRGKRNNNLNESIDDKYYDKIVSILEPPYFQILESIGIDVDYWKDIFNKLYGERVYIDFNGNIRNKKGKVIYYEQSDGYWRKYGYDNNGNIVYYENSIGFWEKSEYDNNGNKTYYENSDGEIIDKRNKKKL